MTPASRRISPKNHDGLRRGKSQRPSQAPGRRSGLLAGALALAAFALVLALCWAPRPWGLVLLAPLPLVLVPFAKRRLAGKEILVALTWPAACLCLPFGLN